MSTYDDASLIMYPSGYKEDKIYSLKPTDGSGDLTFTRASTATRVNSDGLIEQVPYNLLGYSEQFDNAYWSKLTSDSTPAPVVTSNYATSPDGTQTAERVQLTLPTDNQYAVIRRTGVNPNTPVGNIVTQSIYLKATDVSQVGKKVDVYIYDTTNSSYKRILNHVLTNNWERVEVNHLINFGLTCTSVEYVFGKARANASGQGGTTGTITSESATDFLVWGAQLETSSTAKEYFPTTDRLNVPRIDYTGGGCGKLLLEGQRTNLALYSEQPDNVYWTKSGATILTNTINSPSGYVDADKLQEDSSTGVHRYGRATFPSGTQRTFSVFAKKGERDYVSLFENNAVAPQIKGVIFDLNTGALSLNNDAAYYTNPTITDYGNGWYRCSATWTPLSLSVPSIGVSADGLTNSYAGTTGSGIFVWGAQLEAGSYVSSYVPTLASSVTRLADAAFKTGISSLIGQTEGTLFVEFDAIDVSDSRITISDGTSINRLIFRIHSNGTFQWEGVQSGADQWNIQSSSGTIVSGSTYKIAATYGTNDVALYINGTQIGVDNSAVVTSALNAIKFANASTGTLYHWNQYTKQALLFKTRLSNDQLADLTGGNKTTFNSLAEFYGYTIL